MNTLSKNIFSLLGLALLAGSPLLSSNAFAEEISSYKYNNPEAGFNISFEYPAEDVAFKPRATSGNLNRTTLIFYKAVDAPSQEEFDNILDSGFTGGHFWIWWEKGQSSTQDILGNTVKDSQGTEKTYNNITGTEFINVTQASINAFIFNAAGYTFAVIDPKIYPPNSLSETEWKNILNTLQISESNTEELQDGQLVKMYNDNDSTTSEDATVYLISDGQKHQFLNEEIYGMYYSSFDNVLEINKSTLAEIPIGTPMLPPAETWIKMESSPRVYEVQTDGETIRWISSEQAAEKLRGANWNKNIKTIDVILYPYFQIGEIIN